MQKNINGYMSKVIVSSILTFDSIISGSGVQVPPLPPKVRKNLNPSAKDVKGEVFRYIPKVVGDWKYDSRYHFKTKRTSLHCCGQ